MWTRSPRVAGNLSSVMEAAPFSCSSLFIFCNICTQEVSFSLNSQVFFGLALGTVGRSKISSVYASIISDSFPYFSSQMLFVLLYPSGVKDKASILRFALESKSFLKYENLTIAVTLVLSIVSKNFSQNRGHSRKRPSNFAITSFGYFAWVSLDVIFAR